MRVLHWIGILIAVTVLLGPLTRWASRQVSHRDTTLYFACNDGWAGNINGSWILEVRQNDKSGTLRTPSGSSELVVDSFGPDIIELSWWVKAKPYRLWINRLQGNFVLASFDKTFRTTGACKQQQPPQQ